MKTLREAREERGITQKFVAEKLGTSRQAYARWENDPGNMKVKDAKAACDAIGCDFNVIFFTPDGE